jgi:hypothetical protein
VETKADYGPSGRPGGGTFDELTSHQARTHELISTLVDRLRPILSAEDERENMTTPEMVAPSQLSERVRDQQSINRRLDALLARIDL